MLKEVGKELAQRAETHALHMKPQVWSSISHDLNTTAPPHNHHKESNNNIKWRITLKGKTE